MATLHRRSTLANSTLRSANGNGVRVDLLFYAGRDNVADVVLTEGDEPVDSSAVTRVLLSVGNTEFDSQLNPTYFEWPVALVHKGQAVNGLRFVLGGAGLTGRYDLCRLTIFDLDHPSGLVWSEAFSVTVRS